MVSIRATNNFSLAWLEKLYEVQKCVKILFIIAVISNEFQLSWYHPELKKLVFSFSSLMLSTRAHKINELQIVFKFKLCLHNNPISKELFLS